ncbi:MAG: hypothetical protein WC635_11940 [Bacteriovorax sp.]
MKNYFALFLIMGCIGITVEIFFTAIYDLALHTNRGLSLEGHSYIWMFPLYGLTALTFPPLIKFLDAFKWWGRGVVFGLGILVVEYISGALLRHFTGTCPWEYKQGLHINGLIRLDFYPLWVVFGSGVEVIISWLHPRVS